MTTIPPATPADLALMIESVYQQAGFRELGHDGKGVSDVIQSLVRLAAHWKREAERRSEALADELGRFGPDP